MHLKDKVRDQLMLIAQKWAKFAKIPASAIEDVVLTGGNANYNYTRFSDLDVHLIVDYSKIVDCEEDFVGAYLRDKKTIWELTHDIKIYGVPVELYGEPKGLPMKKSQGVYSLMRSKWLQKPKKEKVDINQIVQEVVRQAQNLDNHRMIQTDLSPNLLALGDPDAIKQILLILLDNALKYSDDAILVRAFSAQGLIKVSVKDEGKGISPKELEHVFDRFYRSDRTSTIPGFGLGLPIAKSLAEAMEGQIAIQSKVGEGSIITFTLLEV